MRSRNFWVDAYYKTVTRCLRYLQWLLGASTVGVRILVVDQNQQILLVRHTYMEKWHFPGGGVLSGEPARLAAIRELREESAIIAFEMVLFGVYFHKVRRVNDYVILYTVQDFQITDEPICAEIAEAKWFSLQNLPEDLGDHTGVRIQEYFANLPKTDQW